MGTTHDPQFRATPVGAVGGETGYPEAGLALPGAALAGRRRRSSAAAALAAWDALLPVGLFAATAVMEGAAGPAGGVCLLLALLAPPGLLAAGAYDEQRRAESSRLRFAATLGVVSATISWLALLGATLLGATTDLVQLAVVSAILPAGWLLGRWALDQLMRASPERVLVVGSGAASERVVRLVARHRAGRQRVIGRVEDGRPNGAPGAAPVVGAIADLPALLESHEPDRVLVAAAPGQDAGMLEALRECLARGVRVNVVPRFPELLGPEPRAYSLGGLALLEVRPKRLNGLERATKRTVDAAGAAALMLLFLPLIGAIAGLLLLRDGRPLLFRQLRVGRGGRVFEILKFRTMVPAPGVEAADPGPVPVAGDPPHAAGGIGAVVQAIKQEGVARTTRLGRLLRATSLDELPQLWNVLRGDMSLVGPRPLRPFEVGALEPWQLARHELRPGLTGSWQVLGRSEIDWEERIQLDVSYIQHWSLLTDARILLRTVPAVFKKQGAI